MKKGYIAIILGVTCLLLTTGIFIQAKTVSSNITKVGRTKMENELRDSALKAKEKYDNTYKDLETKEKELNTYREKAASTDENSGLLSTMLDQYNSLLGYTEIVGPGIVVILEDADNSIIKLNPSSYVVHDGDLIEVINALKNAGAEAISVNGQRIVSLTAVTCAGNIITINGQKVGTPFVINAVGSTVRLYGALTMPGGYLETLKIDGIKVSVERIEKSTILVPKYSGVYKFDFAANVE